MSLVLSIGLFLLWQLLVLWGALRLVRFAGGADRLPRPARIPREYITGEWTAGQGAPAAGDPTGSGAVT